MTVTLQDSLIDRVKTKPWTREEVESIPEFCKTQEYRNVKFGVCGRTSFADMGRRHKYIDRKSWRYTPFELGRAYLDWIMEEANFKRKSLGYSHKTIEYLKHYPPMFFRGNVKGALCYVDLVSAYFQLYSPLTLDLDYCLESGFLGRGIVEFKNSTELRQCKKMRNGLIGTIKSNTLTLVHKGKQMTVKRFSKYSAPDLWGYVIHSLHAIARSVLEKFKEAVHYINIDGYVVDLSIKEAMQDYLFTEWGLETSIKGEHEKGKMTGFGSYSIGGHKTKNILSSEPLLDGLMDLSHENINFLQESRMWAVGFGMAA